MEEVLAHGILLKPHACSDIPNLINLHCKKWMVVLTKNNVISVSPKPILAIGTLSFKEIHSIFVHVIVYA